MAGLPELEPETSLNAKRCQISDDEDFCDRSGCEEDRDGIEESANIERKRFKRFKDNDDEESIIERSKDEAQLFGGESSDKDEAQCALSPALKNNDQEETKNQLSSVFQALQKVQEVFAIDFNADGSVEEKIASAYPTGDDTNPCKKVESTAEKKPNSTDLDNEILVADIPERMQLRSPAVTPASEEELISEAQWIYKQAFERKTISIQDAHLTAEAKERARKGPDIVPKIIITLELVKNQHLEVPFIAFYRKEYVLPELNLNDLWKIYKFDAKWCELSRRREALLSLYQQMKSHQDANAKHGRSIDDDDIERLENAQTIEELNDFYHHFMLHHGPEISKMQNKEEHADDSYSAYRKAGLDCLAKKFGLTSKQFAVNLSQQCQVHKVEREPAIPCVLALNYINEQFRSTDEVLEAAKLMMATQIAREPLFRESARKMYVEEAKISVRPTKKGIRVIDEGHPIYTMKYLKDKPVKDLVGDQYLKLAVAQDEQLIAISFSDQLEGNYLERTKQLCCRGDTDKHAQDWNLLRAGSVEAALTKMIIPQLQKELHSTLLNEAKDCVMRSCARKIYDSIKVAPYRFHYPSKKKDDEWDSSSEGLRVMGVAYVTDHSVAAFACIVSPDGECTDYLNLPNLLRMKNSSLDKSTTSSVLGAIENMLVARKPHVIAIGGESSDALDIARDFRGMIARLVGREAHFPNIAVEIVENEAAVVYSTSRKGVADFPGYPVVLRQAISLARRLQDPLVEFSQLCNADDDEILRLKLHDLQEQLHREDLLDNVHAEFVNRVNEVGVDVNKAVQRPYFANLLQFVCGLGPRKARYIIETLKQTGQELKSRQQLTTLCHVGPKLFANCAGFIKINSAKALDGSRVHPENCDWAGKIATDALDYAFEKANFEVAFKEIRNYPDKLKDLDLDAFAEELARQGFGNKCITLYDIRSELTCRYKDLRIPYQSPTSDKLFGIFARQTPEEFYVGKLVEATIVAIGTGMIWLRLDNGITGYIRTKNLSDEHVADPEQRVRVGSRVYCRIMQIETDKFYVEASSKGSDLADRNGEWRLPKDRFYDTEAEAKAELIDERARNMEQKQYADAKSAITHRCFRNVNYADAEILMQTARPGDVVIRPSSKGEGHFCFTWKVADGVNQHIAVREDRQKSKSSIEGNFWIGDDAFQSFDDVIARFINPMAAHAAELLNFKYYKPQIMGMRDRAEETLRWQKRNNPRGIPYIISADKNNPGKFLLSYLPRDQCLHSYITLTPSGLKFGDYCFARLHDLIHWFKKHSKDSIPEQITPIAPIVRRASLDVKVNKITPERIHNVARNLPQSMLHALSQVVDQSRYSSQTEKRIHY